jgi:hypothetical protein
MAVDLLVYCRTKRKSGAAASLGNKKREAWPCGCYTLFSRAAGEEAKGKDALATAPRTNGETTAFESAQINRRSWLGLLRESRVGGKQASLVRLELSYKSSVIPNPGPQPQPHLSKAPFTFLPQPYACLPRRCAQTASSPSPHIVPVSFAPCFACSCCFSPLHFFGSLSPGPLIPGISASRR